MTSFKQILRVAGLALVLMLGACESIKRGIGTGYSPAKTDFVSVESGKFMLRGEPYYFVGTNFWYGAYLGASDGIGDRDRLLRELDLLKATGITNLRVLASSEKTNLVMALDPAIHEQPGKYNEDLLVGLDFLLAEMAKRDMKAVLFLNNFWQWSGGMSQYVSWVDGQPVFDPDVTGDWNGFMQNSAKFYRLPEAQVWFRQLIETVVLRENTVNGRKYNNDPTIMSWQLANEPRPGSDAAGRPYYPHFKNWVEETAHFIHDLAPNQLVSTGSEGAMGTLRDLELYVDTHSTPSIDYLTVHLWPKNWSWFDMKNPEESYPSAIAQAKDYVMSHIKVAEQLNKPIVLEEFGIERDHGDYRISSTTTYRDRFLKEMFAFIAEQAKAGAPIAGSNFWAWGGFGRSQSEDLIWQAGDAYVGDPPQEAQGLNSVFDEDKSTLEIIAEHARQLEEIR